ncbi:endoplasmic reticulum aminopeptidase 2-like [Conger conger]|uniref:endoplasmic reticulum aminopeptidase 2-like n=1 Tax=Conger conger TaxID=82655 RepID=UPI002A59F717|nr:endoplasmic reticulum aminopeptidase 2-like [Conger conger]
MVDVWQHLVSRLKLVVCFQLALACTGFTSEASSSQPFPWNQLRLPNNVVPKHYDLSIHPNLRTLNFTGTVRISVDVKQDTSYIVLHSKGLDITKAKILGEDDGKPVDKEQNLTVLEHLEQEQIALLLPYQLQEGRKYQLHIEFQASLADDFDGFYKSTYMTRDGEKRVLAATDFEPTAARMAFPCFDEPLFKATFSIKIRRERRHIALSNMPRIQTVEHEDGLVEDIFDKSVRMSTYLVAFVVSDFRSVSATTSSGVKVSVYAIPEKLNQTHYALEVAVKLLEFYEVYFNISFPLPKQDLIAIPDFMSGAMENWGLITYRETALLYDPHTSSATDKFWVTRVISHELAHQWFGNLVTMEWWNDIWLNEGFARYMEKVSLSSTYPEMKADENFLGVCFGAIYSDCLNSSRPISNPAETPVQIMEMFDSVSYDKGACILNMLRDFLSEEVFQRGIIHYLQKYSYSNAKSADLWNTVANASIQSDLSTSSFCYAPSHAEKNAVSHKLWYTCENLDVREMMDTWTHQMGIPLITVERTGASVRIRQERFLKGILDDDAEYPSLQAGYLWHIPITYFTNHSKTPHRHLLKTKTDTIQLEGEVGWIKVNVDMSGYYMVHYGEEGWDALISLLDQNHTALSSKDRTNLIQNAFQLVSTGKMSLYQALNLTRYLNRETENLPLIQGISYISLLYLKMELQNVSSTAESLKTYVLRYFRDVIDKQTWNDEGSMSERKLRAAILKLSCVLGYPPCVQKASQLFGEWLASNGTKRVPADVLTPVFLVGAQDATNWNLLLNIYKSSLSSSYKKKILSALTSSKDPDKLVRLINLAMEGEVIRTQDLGSVIVAISLNPAGQTLAWNFLQKNWKQLLEKFHVGSSSFRKILTGTTGHVSSKKELEEVKAFFDLLKAHGHKLKVTEVVIEGIQKNIRWLERNLHMLNKWLSENTPSEPI